MSEPVPPAPDAKPFLPAEAFRGLTAFVTGGGTGLGLAVSTRLGRLGARVVCASRDVAHHETLLQRGRAEGFEVLSVAMDVRRPNEVKDAFRLARDTCGGVDVLVNNAAGNFVRPALVIDPKPTLRVVTEEQFGPVIPIIPFDTEEEAIKAANDTWAGLAGSVWTADPATANRVGSQMVCGYVWVNDHGANRLDLRAPFGGMKQSGIGREQGIEGIRAFQDTRSIAHLDAATLATMHH